MAVEKEPLPKRLFASDFRAWEEERWVASSSGEKRSVVVEGWRGSDGSWEGWGLGCGGVGSEVECREWKESSESLSGSSGVLPLRCWGLGGIVGLCLGVFWFGGTFLV